MIVERVGIKICSYDYSEPQHGKDICDRTLCPVKQAIRKYSDEGHDILRARNMRKALLERLVRRVTASINKKEDSNTPFFNYDLVKSKIRQVFRKTSNFSRSMREL